MRKVTFCITKEIKGKAGAGLVKAMQRALKAHKVMRKAFSMDSGE